MVNTTSPKINRLYADMYKAIREIGGPLLDKKGPENWRQKLNTKRLVMGNTRKCILGQLYGDFLVAYGWGGVVPGDLGIDVFFGGFDINGPHIRRTYGLEGRTAYTVLKEAWIDYLKETA